MKFGPNKLEIVAHVAGVKLNEVFKPIYDEYLNSEEAKKDRDFLAALKISLIQFQRLYEVYKSDIDSYDFKNHDSSTDLVLNLADGTGVLLRIQQIVNKNASGSLNSSFTGAAYIISDDVTSETSLFKLRMSFENALVYVIRTDDSDLALTKPVELSVEEVLKSE